VQKQILVVLTFMYTTFYAAAATA